jgi:hypothetical protein
MSPTRILLAILCMGMGALALAADPTPPATTSAAPPGSTDTASPAAADSAAADKAVADKAVADKAAADKAAADKAKSAAKTATGPGGVTPDQAKTLRSAGYKSSVQRDGQVYYCRYEAQLGSRFETKMCDTAENIMLSIANSKDAVNQMQRTPTGTRSN